MSSIQDEDLGSDSELSSLTTQTSSVDNAAGIATESSGVSLAAQETATDSELGSLVVGTAVLHGRLYGSYWAGEEDSKYGMTLAIAKWQGEVVNYAD